MANWKGLSVVCLPSGSILKGSQMYTAIFLTNELCVGYRTRTQCLNLVYLGRGHQKSELFAY